jgi:hypothetical protein
MTKCIWGRSSAYLSALYPPNGSYRSRSAGPVFSQQRRNDCPLATISGGSFTTQRCYAVYSEVTLLVPAPTSPHWVGRHSSRTAGINGPSSHKQPFVYKLKPSLVTREGYCFTSSQSTSCRRCQDRRGVCLWLRCHPAARSWCRNRSESPAFRP